MAWKCDRYSTSERTPKNELHFVLENWLKNIVQCCISFNYFELKNHEDDEVIFRGICICQAKVDEK